MCRCTGVTTARLLLALLGMLSALHRFIEGLSSARLSLTEEQVHKVLVFLEEQLAHTADAVHEAAAAALHAFSRAYWLPAGNNAAALQDPMPGGTFDPAQQEFVARYCTFHTAAVRRAYAWPSSIEHCSPCQGCLCAIFACSFCVHDAQIDMLVCLRLNNASNSS